MPTFQEKDTIYIYTQDERDCKYNSSYKFNSFAVKLVIMEGSLAATSHKTM
jgi:hypothetical protein